MPDLAAYDLDNHPRAAAASANNFDSARHDPYHIPDSNDDDTDHLDADLAHAISVAN